MSTADSRGPSTGERSIQEALEADIVRHPEEVADDYRARGVWRGATLGEELDVVAAGIPDHVAVVGGAERLTYRELAEQTDRVAAGLLGLGARSGERALFQMGNVVDTIRSYFGCLKAGVIPVCTLPLHGPAEMNFMAEHTQARFVFVQADLLAGALLDQAQELRRQHAALKAIVATGDEVPGVEPLSAMVETSLPPEGLPEVDYRSVAVFQLSGGTTAVPKVIPRFHEEYASNGRAFGAFLGWGHRHVVMHCLPIMHNAGLGVALQSALLAGSRFVLVAEPQGEAVVDAIEREQVTDIPCLPPAIVLRMLAVEGVRNRVGSLERMLVAGQRLPEGLADRIENELGIPCLQSFGMGEGLITVTPPGASERIRKHTVGRPVSPLDEVRILDPLGDAVPDGELGELAARGPYTIRGYYRAAERNAQAFTRDGFYRTGDLARLVYEEGQAFISVEGRIKDVINRGGEKINAEEIENLLIEHPGIEAAAVVAMPDPELGERACAYVTLVPGADPLDLAQVVAFLQSYGIAKFKLPERLEVVDALPLTNVGKVSKEQLRRDIEQRLEREAAGG